MKTNLSRLLALGLAAFLAGCASPTSDPAPTPAPEKTLVSIAVSPVSVALDIDATRTITVKATYSDSSTATVTADSWASADDTKVTVAAGVVTAKAATSSAVNVTATYKTKTASVAVTVNTPVVIEPVVTTTLYNAAGAADITADMDNWSSGTTLSDVTTETGYAKVLHLVSGTGWGDVSAVGFNNIIPSGKLTQFTDVAFKVKTTSYTAITVKLPKASTPEVTVNLSLGTDLGNGWIQMKVPMSSFGTLNPLENQVGFFKFGAGEMLLTDIGFTGTAAFTTAALTSTISAAQTLANAAVVGTADGNVSQSTKDALDAAITTAQGLTVTTFAQVFTAVGDLETAISAYKAGVIKLAPSSLAGTPSLGSGSVVSLYTSSATYTDHAGISWNPNWGQGGSISDFDVGGKNVKKLDLKNYQGVDFDGARIDATTFHTLHISYWSANGTGFKLFPIWAAGEGGIDVTASTHGAWTDLEIDLSTVSGADLSTLRQLKFDTAPSFSAGVYYLDNVYLH